MTDVIHTCSYFCERVECIKAQRDELRNIVREQAELLRLEKAIFPALQDETTAFRDAAHGQMNRANALLVENERLRERVTELDRIAMDAVAINEKQAEKVAKLEKALNLIFNASVGVPGCRAYFCMETASAALTPPPEPEKSA